MQRDEQEVEGKQRRFWVVNILMRSERPILGRLISACHRLLRLPRWIRRLLQRRLAVPLGGIALLLVLSHAPARAKTIHVQDGEVAIAADFRCSLREAVANATDPATGQPHPDCTAGDPLGPDTITLPSNGTFTLAGPHGDGALSYYSAQTGLPIVHGTVTIEGHGSAIRRDPTDPDRFRLLAVGEDGELTLNELTITGFDAEAASGGAVFSAGILVVNDSTLSGNTAPAGYGGAINLYGTDFTLTIRHSTLSGNQAEEGGAIAARTATGGNWGTMWIEDSTLTGNATFGQFSSGGALFTFDFHAIIANSAFIGNSANHDGVGGGFHNGGISQVTGTTFSENTANRGGAIDNAGSLHLTNSTLSGNTAGQDGGAISNFDSATVTNSTLTGNSAQRGGGIFNHAFVSSYGTVTLIQSIVSGNVAGDAGRELYNATAS
jgi:hypothetical protein